MKRAQGVGAVTVLLAALVLPSCDGGSQAPRLTPALTISVTAPTVPLLQGATTAVTVNIVRTGGFRGAVQITAEGAAGVTIAPLTIGPEAVSGTLQVTAAPDATPVDATITVRANGSGVSERTVTFPLSVRAPPSFTLSMAPASLTVQQGSSGTATVSVARTGGFTGPVSLSASGAPAGMTVSFEPASVSGGAATVTVAVAPGTPAGSFPVAIRGTSGTAADRTTTLTVTVPAPAIALQVTPAALQVTPGGSGSVNVAVARTGGFAGAVVLTAENVPTGVTVTGGTIAAGASSATLTLSATAAAAIATNSITIRGSAAGVPDATATVSLTVSAPGQPGGFALAVAPANVTVATGGSTNATLTVLRTGDFSGAVAVSAAGAPAGLTVTINPASVSGAQATIGISASAGLAAGTYPITLRGVAAGQPEQTATLNVTVTTTSGMSIAVAPTLLELTPGTSGSVTVTLTRGGGFTGPAILTAENVPPGVAVSGATIAAGATSTTVTISVSAAAVLMTSHITIRATGTGVADATAGLDLTVRQGAGYTMSLNPGTVTLPPGGTVNATVNLARVGGFTGAVELSATGAPAGLTVAFNPASATGNQAAVTVSASAAVAAGTYPITIRGTSGGLTDRTALLNVVVAGGGQTGGNVTWRFCAATGLPIWVAAQDDTGAWTRVTGNANHEYSFQVDARGGIAYVVNNFEYYELNVQYGAREELQARGAALCAAAGGATRTVNGNVVGMEASDVVAQIAMGGALTAVLPRSGLDFQLTNVQPGTVDLVAARIGASPFGQITNRLFIQRGLNPPHNGSVTVDFTSAQSFDPAMANVTLFNLGGDHASVLSSYLTANGTTAILGFDPGASAAASRPFVGVPANRQVAGDFHMLTAEAIEAGSTDPTHQRTVAHVFRTMADRAFSFGPNMSPVQVSVVAAQPYARLRLSYAVQTEYSSYFTAVFSQDTRDATIQMTAGYLSGPNVVLDVPNFSAVAGWDNDWGLRPGAETTWSASAAGWPANGATPLNPWVDNTVFRGVSRWGVVNP